MKTLWEGYYYDGISAVKREAKIRITTTSLEFTCLDNDNTEYSWPLENIRQSSGFYKGEEVRFEFYPKPSHTIPFNKTQNTATQSEVKTPEALVIKDSHTDNSFLTAIRETAPDFSGSFHDPKIRIHRRAIIVISTLLTITAAAAIYLWGIPAVSDLAARTLPLKWEEKLGERVTKSITKDLQLCEAPLAIDSTQQILERLNLASADKRYDLKLHIVNHKMINAFAAPGGNIILFSGLLENSKSPEELAAVLAHELQHITEHHSTKGVFQALSTRVLLGLIFGDVNRATDMIHTLGTMSYSREFEAEADRLGMELLIKAKIDPKGAISFFETLEAKKVNMPKGMKYLSTHPLTGERIENLKAMIPAGGVEITPLLPGVIWEEVKKSCVVETDKTLNQVQGDR
jgi:Zn-dependent protease with chaperone function